MQDVASGTGRTVLFVSHNMVCHPVFMRAGGIVERGRVEGRGPAASVIARNLRAWIESDGSPGTIPRARRATASCGSGAISVTDAHDPDPTLLSMQTEIRIETEYTVDATNSLLHITYHLLNDQGITVLDQRQQTESSLCGNLSRGLQNTRQSVGTSGDNSLKLFIRGERKPGNLLEGGLAFFQTSWTLPNEKQHGWGVNRESFSRFLSGVLKAPSSQ